MKLKRSQTNDRPQTKRLEQKQNRVRRRLKQSQPNRPRMSSQIHYLSRMQMKHQLMKKQLPRKRNLPRRKRFQITSWKPLARSWLDLSSRGRMPMSPGSRYLPANG